MCSCDWWGGGGGKDFKFGTFISHFPSDGVADMTVKGLTDTQTVFTKKKSKGLGRQCETIEN